MDSKIRRISGDIAIYSAYIRSLYSGAPAVPVQNITLELSGRLGSRIARQE